MLRSLSAGAVPMGAGTVLLHAHRARVGEVSRGMGSVRSRTRGGRGGAFRVQVAEGPQPDQTGLLPGSFGHVSSEAVAAGPNVE